jgi:hypothetical protein
MIGAGSRAGPLDPRQTPGMPACRPGGGRRGCRIGRSDLRQIADFGVRILRTPKIAVFHEIEAILPWFSENGFLGTSEKRRKCRLCCALCAQKLVVVQMRILRF